MRQANRSFPTLFASTVAAAMLLTPGLTSGGCFAASLPQLAAVGPLGAGLGGMVQKLMPGGPTQTAPCAPGAVAGCNAGASGPGVVGKALPQRVPPVAGAQTGSVPPCAAGGAGASAPGCGVAGAGSVAQGLAGALQKFAPGSLFSH